jgi:hypothetical protein
VLCPQEESPMKKCILLAALAQCLGALNPTPSQAQTNNSKLAYLGGKLYIEPDAAIDSSVSDQ